MQYNEILKELREEKKLTQTDLGKIFNLTQRQISTYETGRNEPPYETLILYAKYFNVSTDYILGLTREQTPHWTNKIIMNNKVNKIENSFNGNNGTIGNININQS